MKLFKKAKDGGQESTVTGYWLCEVKSLFSVVLLKFEDGSRDAFHSHAFHSLNWVLKGRVVEYCMNENTDQAIHGGISAYLRSLMPILTKRSTFHKVVSDGTTWVLSFRGPWAKTWKEYIPRTGKYSTLTHGRKEVT